MAAFMCKIRNKTGQTVNVNILKPGTTLQFSALMYVDDEQMANLAEGNRVVVVSNNTGATIIHTTSIFIDGPYTIDLDPATTVPRAPAPGAFAAAPAAPGDTAEV